MNWLYLIIHVVVPGPVEGLSFIKISPTLLQITWSSPSVTNGVIQSYLVQVERYDGLVYSDSVEGEQTSVLVPNLSKKFYTMVFIYNIGNKIMVSY